MKKTQAGDEVINVEAFREIQIHFSEDVYFLAIWIVRSNQAKSTPTSRLRTRLTGLAKNFAVMYGTDYSNPLDSDDVMAIFREHGIKGNPMLTVDCESMLENQSN